MGSLMVEYCMGTHQIVTHDQAAFLSLGREKRVWSSLNALTEVDMSQ